MLITEEIRKSIEERPNKKQDKPLFISVTGGGGKTTFLKVMSKACKAEGRSVLLTTSTKFQSPQYYDWGADHYCFSLDELKEYVGTSPRPGVVLFAKPWSEGPQKLISPTDEEIAAASGMFDVTICEADGSKGLPLKIHSKRDPVIHELTDFTVAIMGLGGVLKKASDVVFGARYEESQVIVDHKYIDEYIKNPEGLLKGEPSLIILNGADAVPAEVFEEINKVHWPEEIPVIMGSLMKDRLSKGVGNE